MQEMVEILKGSPVPNVHLIYALISTDSLAGYRTRFLHIVARFRDRVLTVFILAQYMNRLEAAALCSIGLLVLTTTTSITERIVASLKSTQ